jgi:hypothetical protein
MRIVGSSVSLPDLKQEVSEGVSKKAKKEGLAP